MRFADAPHVDMRPLLARRPCLGQWYARAGWIAVLLLAWSTQCTSESAACFQFSVAIGAGVLWFVAWYQAVGRLWRAPLVLALAVYSLFRMSAMCAACSDCVGQGCGG